MLGVSRFDLLLGHAEQRQGRVVVRMAVQVPGPGGIDLEAAVSMLVHHAKVRHAKRVTLGSCAREPYFRDLGILRHAFATQVHDAQKYGGFLGCIGLIRWKGHVAQQRATASMSHEFFVHMRE